MSEQRLLESLPDRAMKRSELDSLADGESVEWVEPLRSGVKDRENMVDAWVLETDGTAHVLLYEVNGWMPQGSFATDGMDDDDKRERADEILGF
jgi:hypothetical protein